MTADPRAFANTIAMDWLRERVWLAENKPEGPPQQVVAPVVSLERHRQARRRRSHAESKDEDALRNIPPVAYVEALTGIEVPVHGTICCPLHEERTPSFKVYAGHVRGWYCFGCGAGGDIYNLGAELWGLSLRTDFPELRRRLACELLRAWA